MSDKPKCKGPECDRDMVARQLCGTHVQQLYAGKELTPIRKPLTLEQSKKEFGVGQKSNFPRVTAEKLYTGSISSQNVTDEGVRSSATEYDARIEPEAFDRWLEVHDSQVIMEVANEFAKGTPYSWRQDAAYEIAELAKDRWDGQ